MFNKLKGLSAIPLHPKGWSSLAEDYMGEKLYIKGHDTRYKGVISLLETLGATNKYGLTGENGVNNKLFYTLDYQPMNGKWYISATSCPQYDSIIMSLEEFEQQYPYKIGDQVWFNGNKEIINRMEWTNGGIKYGFFNTKNLPMATIYELAPFNGKIEQIEYAHIVEETKNEENVSCGVDTAATLTLDDFLPLIDFKLYSGHKYEVRLHDYELKEENGKLWAIKKKISYPTSCEECCDILDIIIPLIDDLDGYKGDLLSNFQKLLICRDAYWKICGDWKPDWSEDNEQDKYCIFFDCNKIQKSLIRYDNTLLVFPTEECRDEFLKHFSDLIEKCKTLF